MSDATVTFARTHDMDATADYAIFDSLNADGTGATRQTSWKRLWPNPGVNKIGLGGGYLGWGTLGGSNLRFTTPATGLGGGLLGELFLGLDNVELSSQIKDLVNGIHTFTILLRDKARNVGTNISSEVLSLQVCNRPPEPRRLRLVSSSGQTIDLAWST